MNWRSYHFVNVTVVNNSATCRIKDEKKLTRSNIAAKKDVHREYERFVLAMRLRYSWTTLTMFNFLNVLNDGNLFRWIFQGDSKRRRIFCWIACAYLLFCDILRLQLPQIYSFSYNDLEWCFHNIKWRVEEISSKFANFEKK